MTLVTRACATTNSSGLYDCAGKAGVLRTAAKASSEATATHVRDGLVGGLERR
jgi:hypothetical protein